jgi:hypothetical protein
LFIAADKVVAEQSVNKQVGAAALPEQESVGHRIEEGSVLLGSDPFLGHDCSHGVMLQASASTEHRPGKREGQSESEPGG